jgi:uncharacterized protein
MAAGVIRGILMGTVVSVAGLSTLSVISGMPPQGPRMAAVPAMEPAIPPVPQTAAVDVPRGTPFDAPRSDEPARLPQADATPPTASAPGLDPAAAPAPLDVTGRDPAAAPSIGPDGGPQPTSPTAADAPRIAATPPDTGTARPAAAPGAPQPPTSPGAGPVVTGPALAPMSSDPAQPDQAMTADETRPPVPSPVEEERSDIAALAPMPAPAPAPRRTPLPVIQPAPPAVTPAQEAPSAMQPAAESAPVIRPSIGTPGISLVDRPATPPGEQAASAASSDSVIPLRRNAIRFDDPDNRPRLAIVLIDRGDSGIDLDALRDFPYPLTVAVDAARAEAPEAAARYRAAGFEVMALVDLAPDSTPQDAEIAMEVSLAAVPEAVAVLEGDATGFQATRALSEQVSAIAGQRGYGLVMMPSGLNTAQRQAARQGVAAATVFRDFDGAGQDAAAIRRFLDQGAFRAGQQTGAAEDGEGVIMLGRLRPDTISALILWGLQDRARRVALAPVSAVLDPAD